MTKAATIRAAVNAAFKQAANKPLSPAGKKAWNSVVKLTVLDFAKAAATSTTPDDVWANEKFKKFILSVAGNIGATASAKTKQGKISPKTVVSVSTSVMTKWKKKCQIAIVNGKVLFPQVEQGMVCGLYLDSRTKTGAGSG